MLHIHDLNIFFLVNDKAMLNFIVNKTANAYFCNLIWYIGNHAIELEKCSITESEYVGEILNYKQADTQTGYIEETSIWTSK
jgi:hypothetical protein